MSKNRATKKRWALKIIALSPGVDVPPSKIEYCLGRRSINLTRQVNLGTRRHSSFWVTAAPIRPSFQNHSKTKLRLSFGNRSFAYILRRLATIGTHRIGSSWGGLNNELRCICACLAAGKADRSAAGRCQSEVIGAISRHISGHVESDPNPCTKGSGRTNDASDC